MNQISLSSSVDVLENSKLDSELASFWDEVIFLIFWFEINTYFGIIGWDLVEESFVFSITQKCNLISVLLHWTELIMTFRCRKKLYSFEHRTYYGNWNTRSNNWRLNTDHLVLNKQIEKCVLIEPLMNLFLLTHLLVLVKWIWVWDNIADWLLDF